MLRAQGEQFVLISPVEVPRHYDIAMLQAELDAVAAESGAVSVRLMHENIVVATTQLRMRVDGPATLISP